jgi:uncharacterized DUF497 family protein
MEIVWDEPKRLANLDKHGLDFADLNEAFFDNALVVPSRRKRVQAARRSGPRERFVRLRASTSSSPV